MKSLLGAAWKPPKRVVHVVQRWRTARHKPSSKYSHQHTRGGGLSKLPPDGFPKNPHAERSLRSGLQTEGSSASRRPAFVTRRNYQLFSNLVESRFAKVLESMGAWSEKQEEWRSFGITSQTLLDRESGLFKMVLNKAFELATDGSKTSRQDNPLFWNLRNAFIRSDAAGLARELKIGFQTYLMRNRFPKTINELHQALADMRFPYEWYPATRMMQRTVHLHVGPTNSGKTYNALLALENSRTGIYAGPLRLLAHETYSRFTAKDKPCALITGEEMRIPSDKSDTWFHSCTVEMAPLNARVDVAVIDEIQMIADDDRGWAWTQAFLGVQAKEVHLCGEERVVPLIQDLCARIGEKCVVHHYKRLNPLEVMDKSMKGKFTNLQKGDAIIAFSKVAIHQLKVGIEKATGRRCAIVYGSLPPETRASQAALFNDPNNEYDFLVASDAIGMGLNLEVKRVIFESSFKFDGVSFRHLTTPEIKQIGGRAGRYRTAAQAIKGDTTKPPPGLVSTLDDEDLENVGKAFKLQPGPIPTAGLFPPASVIERFHSYFPAKTPISFVLARLREIGRLSPRFHMCNFNEALAIAEIIRDYDLSITDRCVFIKVPINLRDPKQVRALQSFANCVAELGSGRLLDFDTFDLNVLDEVRPSMAAEQAKYLQRLESLHQTITMYLWLSYRYQGVFQSQNLAFKVKTLVEEKIANHLEKLSFTEDWQRLKRQRVRKMGKKLGKKEATLLGPGEEDIMNPDAEGLADWVGEQKDLYPETVAVTPEGEKEGVEAGAQA
ncbi:P-loop containing nucleoside triphosphate hydrolase protein [Chaetomium fimeti]|uniref:ATP-dependent RNA helicase SUV3, mitochondrial n=1 Tax=Chaetomium fimeti TaxID=1854472 RepID=A0AAE0HEC0_9PEZI|nr:P-loop containing nucleoside triphosphate hydrolase protein [Chaetomium fimeti]